jgi:LysR family transcriptional regulator, glycine cleavage system transcriptional activator
MSATAKNSVPVEAGSQAPVNRPRLPPLKALLAFNAATRHGSFSLGAAELGVTPSAVSHQIQQLEEFLRVRLFQRHAGRAVLTSAGQTYAKEIERALALIHGATNLVAPQSRRGPLVVASSPSFAAKWLQPRWPEFVGGHPDLQIRLSTLSDRDDLEAGHFDVAIAHGHPPETKKHVEPLLIERLRPLCSPTLVAAIGLQSPSDLVQATLIHSVNALTWPEYFAKIGEADLRPSKEIWLDRSAMAIDAAVRGMGVVLESELLAAEELHDGRLVTPFGDGEFTVETTTYYLVKSRDHRNDISVSAFETWLRAALATENPTA